ncbi:hypothetical protein [Streptosporangium roseum]|uniref:hypothetical protein n=1 Tax=Streptosporangium roseum TaxID=2001 RepID=UPI00331D9869
MHRLTGAGQAQAEQVAGHLLPGHAHRHVAEVDLDLDLDLGLGLGLDLGTRTVALRNERLHRPATGFDTDLRASVGDVSAHDPVVLQ